MDEDEQRFFLLLCTTAFLVLLINHTNEIENIRRNLGRGRGRRRWWVRPVNRQREAQGFSHNLLRETQLGDHEEFFNNIRMWPEQFEFLHRLLSPLLVRQRTVMRQPLLSRLRLGLTLMYLAQGGSIQNLHDAFRVGKSTAHQVIGDTCRALWEKLQPIYLPELKRADFENVAARFFNRWQLPNCVGAVDGRHMRIKAPPMSGSLFYNYKGFFSTVLLAIVDADYKFLYVDIGQYGSLSDGAVWGNSEMGRALQEGRMDLPPRTPLPGTDIPFPHYIVGDEAFPIQSYLMRPFPGRMNRVLPDAERIFNYRLSRARRVSENAFGILTMRWQVLNAAVTCSVEKADDIVKALVCLHNFLMDNERGGYVNSALLEVEQDNGEIQPGPWRAECNDEYFRRLGRVGANRAAGIVAGMRQYLADYLASDIGTEQAPWQYERAFRGQLVLPQ